MILDLLLAVLGHLGTIIEYVIIIIIIITSRIAVGLDSQWWLWILIEKSSFGFQNKQKFKANSLQELQLKCRHTNEWFLPNGFRKTQGFFGITDILTDMFTLATDGKCNRPEWTWMCLRMCILFGSTTQIWLSESKHYICVIISAAAVFPL